MQGGGGWEDQGWEPEVLVGTWKYLVVPEVLDGTKKYLVVRLTIVDEGGLSEGEHRKWKPRWEEGGSPTTACGTDKCHCLLPSTVGHLLLPLTVSSASACACYFYCGSPTTACVPLHGTRWKTTGWEEMRKIGLCCKHIMTISTSIIKRKVNQDIIHTSRGNGQSAKIFTEYEMLEDEASIICLLRLPVSEDKHSHWFLGFSPACTLHPAPCTMHLTMHPTAPSHAT